MTEYGRIHTDGSRSGGQPLTDILERLRTKYCCTTENCNCDEAADIIERLQAENKQLRHDLERQMSIANEHVNEVDTLLREIETLRVEALAERLRGYYEGCANPIVQHDALRDALVDMLHAVCGQTGFAETVRRDSGRVYPWPALDLAEAKAIAALEQSK